MDGGTVRMQTPSVFHDRHCWSNDSVRLTWRDYAGDPARPAVVCLPGLTRNARDFEGVAERAQALGWRVLAVSLRGRGDSGYARDPMTYVPLVYVRDVDLVLAAAGVSRAVLVGTSLGGILALLIAATRREMVAGVVLNDIGPAIEPAGLARIRGYVGRGGAWPSWLHAARAIEEAQRAIFPDWQVADWLAAAKRGCRLAPSGRIVWDYDPRIAEPFRLPGGDGPGIDLWPALGALSGLACASVRGALSDILSAETQARMAREVAAMEAVVVPRAGHAPTLDEPEAWGAIVRVLARVAQASPAK